MHTWNSNAAPVNLSELEDRACYGGLVFASTKDIMAFVPVFPPSPGEDDEKYVIAPCFCITEDNLHLRVARNHVPYDLWQQQAVPADH